MRDNQQFSLFFSQKNSRKISQGFSLIEVMITLSIVIIMIFIAFPAYQRYQALADLSAANMRLLNAQFIAQRYFQRSKSFIGFCGSYPEFTQRISPIIQLTCSEDRYCYRVRALGSGFLASLRSLVSETGSRTITVPAGWVRRTPFNCLVSSDHGGCA